MIPNQIRRRFPAEVLARGAQYWAAGRVTLEALGEGAAEARVRGSSTYAVWVTVIGKDALDYECTCPYFPDHGYCKHIWATLLALDASQAAVVPPSASTRDRGARRPGPPPRPVWSRVLESVRFQMADAPSPEPATWPANRRINYILDLTRSVGHGGLVVELATQKLGRQGAWEPPKRFAYSRARWLTVPDPLDGEIARRLIGARNESYQAPGGQPGSFMIDPAAFDPLLRMMCDTGRCRLRREYGREDPGTLAWDPGEPWDLYLRLVEDGAFVAPAVVLRRDGHDDSAMGGALLLECGLVIRDGRIAPVRHAGAFPLVAALGDGSLRVPRSDVPDLLGALYALPRLPPVEVPAALGVQEVHSEARPSAAIRLLPATPWGGIPRAPAELSFDYGGVSLPYLPDGPPHFDPSTMRLMHRDPAAERRALDQLEAAGFRWQHDYQTRRRVPSVAVSRLDTAIESLAQAGWLVSLEGRPVRRAVAFELGVSSGIDWFDLTADLDFGGLHVSLPELLQGLHGGAGGLTLPDGSLGLLPAEWRDRCAALAELAEATNGQLRFTQTQVALLDALVAALPQVRVDQVFQRARDQLRRFEGVHAAEAPPGFTGELRPYQCQGLGWLHFLRDFGFGGCLADDMGLGKTVQVLALLETRRAAGAGPSLVVVPRSLITNWTREAARFTPSLRVADRSGAQRRREVLAPSSCDLMLTTYGVLRREAAVLRGIEFDYIILDEAQAIKNPQTASAKAARLLHGRHRLALTGTPIENRLSDLWSLFEFLNPGMLGSRLLRTLTGPGDAAADRSRDLLARAVRPFLLRRTKAQVAPELPERLEQTLYVDLEPPQRKLYDELREHYRASLLGRIDRVGLGRSRIQILEALLRLRQAACHPGLLDRKRVAEGGGKLEVLLARLAEAAEEGHKALVFSQFTSLLAIVRARLDAAGVNYEYLDGRTRDRQARVDRFQTDPACTAFLISLKAGGLGLNLTAAEYVFLLDPWWNPAAEAQAIDRAHRIGQTRRVFATRLIARDTVEEKVLALQGAKRKLAEAIISEDNSVIARIDRKDLELLLS